MAGVTDEPFRNLCLAMGASLAVSEMVSSSPQLRKHPKTLLKLAHSKESGIRSVQLLGTDPELLAESAKINIDQGAQIIDLNMGCPAKKVCSVAAGSALLRDEVLVSRILEKVVQASSVPVTLKIRTGWDRNQKNALTIAKIAESSGISALTIHGRTRACKFNGEAEYETIRQVKQAIKIPVIANGDIDSPQKAKYVLDFTGADALMIGRAAQGNPWIFNTIRHYLQKDQLLSSPSSSVIHKTLIEHLENLYRFYGQTSGVKIARKHIHWYLKLVTKHPETVKNHINTAESPQNQVTSINLIFNQIGH